MIRIESQCAPIGEDGGAQALGLKGRVAQVGIQVRVPLTPGDHLGEAPLGVAKQLEPGVALLGVHGPGVAGDGFLDQLHGR